MRVLYLTDRLSLLGGADQHLIQVMESAADRGYRVTVAYGRSDAGVRLPSGASAHRVRGLSTSVESESRLERLTALLEDCDLVHVQNVMNPAALRRATASGRAVVTVQDHRVFCPGMGKTMPDGSCCDRPMSEEACRACLPDVEYRRRMLRLTVARRDAIKGARMVVLSRYMAAELAEAGLVDAEVIPPWVEVSEDREAPGSHLLLAGRLVTHKAALDGWRAWRASATPLALRVAGDGPLAEQMGGSMRLGWLTTSELRRELRGALALLFPAFWQEPFGILGVQALAEGTPVIVAGSGGTVEWSDTGCVRVAARDVDGMADAIRHLSRSPGDALRLGREGQVMVADRFARRIHEARLHAAYRRTAMT